MTPARSALTTLVCCGVLASSGLALAQDAGEEASPPADPAAPAKPDDAAAPSARWPRAVIARPLTLPKGLAQVGADLGANNDFSVLTANVVAGYGISDDLELTGFYLFGLKDFEIKGSFDADIGYKLLRGAAGGKFEAIARVRAGYNVLGEISNPLRVGVQAQYNVTDKFGVITPGQQFSAALEEVTVAGVSGGREIFLQLPVALGYQATPELYVQLDTTLAKIKIADSASAYIGADTTPIAVTATYNAMPALDVIGAIALNLTPPESSDPMASDPGVGDTLTFLIGARYYLGKL